MSEFVIGMTSKILSKNDTLTQSVCNAPMQRCFLKKSRNLSMDGPSVSWNVLEKLDDYLTNKDLLKLFILETITSIYCAKLFKLSFRILVGMLIKSWNQCIGFCTTLQQEGKPIVEKLVEMSFHWGNQPKSCIDSPLLLSCDSKLWHYSWRGIWVNMSIYVRMQVLSKHF